MPEEGGRVTKTRKDIGFGQGRVSATHAFIHGHTIDMTIAKGDSGANA